MIKIFIATFFIAELIIAITVISKIYRLNKCINALNEFIVETQPLIGTLFVGIRELFEEFNQNIIKVKELITKKRQEYLLKTIKTSLIYCCIFFLKGKYKKTVLVYQIIREFYEGWN